MAKKISELPAVSSVATTDLCVVVTSALVTKRATVAQIAAAIGASSAPSGTGFMTVAFGVQDAAALAFPLAVAKGGTGLTSLTIPASALLVGTTDTQTLTGKTIAGASNTLTVRIANDITGLGAGVATFLGAPSSANFATAITDATGSGPVVLSSFGLLVAPLVRSYLEFDNPATTFQYRMTPDAIAADRVLTLPLLAGNDTMVCEAHIQTLTNKTLAGPVVTDFASIGASPASAGALRLAAGSAITAHDSGAAYYTMIQGSGDSVFIGTDAAFGTQSAGINIYSGGATAIGVAASTNLYVTTAATEAWKPITGSALGSTPYGVHGVGVQAMADADQTAAAGVYCYGTIRTTGALTGTRTLTMPVATDAASYTKTYVNTCTGGSITVTDGAGTTVTIATARTAVVRIDAGGAVRVTADVAH